MRLGKLCWRQVGQRTMRALGVVLDTPGFDRRLRVRQRQEPVFVQALIAQSSIETFHVGVLVRLAGSDEREVHAVAKARAYSMATI